MSQFPGFLEHQDHKADKAHKGKTPDSLCSSCLLRVLCDTFQGLT
jgi:hypothetical protein